MVPKRMSVFLPYLWGLFLWLIFLLFQAQGIYGGDSGDLVTASFLGGVPHPPGYPLYTLLGFMLTKLPFSTVAWRMGLLSSLPHAATAALVMYFVWKVTKNYFAAIFSSLALAFNYVFFLYSVTPEVFAGLDLFVISILLLLWEFQASSKVRYLYITSLLLGLSLTHHHLIFFLFPAILYMVFRVARTKKVIRRSSIFMKSMGLLILGLSPYLYVPFAARGNAIVNWDQATTIQNFIRLITRADYGTFTSNVFFGAKLSDRIIGLKAYFQFLWLDLTFFGVLLTVLGFVWLFRVNKQLAYTILLSLFFLGPVFFFYASFPFFNRFTIGTVERFLLPSYTLMALLMGFGIASILAIIRTQRILPSLRHRYIQALLIFVLSLYPFTQLAMTLWRFWGLREDRTVEYLSEDILESAPMGAILLLQKDTILFPTQYSRYVRGLRSDVKLIHMSLLTTPDYPVLVQKIFPMVSVPPSRGIAFIRDFLATNSAKFPIASVMKLDVPSGWVWVPHGLLYLLVSEKTMPTIEQMVATNEAIWRSYHEPDRGILSRYNHLMLSDVRGVYASGRLEFGKILLKAQKFEQAKTQFEKSLAAGGDQQSEGYIFLGVAHLALKQCDSALLAFSEARHSSFAVNPAITLYEAQTYRVCVGDEKRAAELMAIYEKQKKSQETPLE